MSIVRDASFAARRSRTSALRTVFAVCGVSLGWLSADAVYALFVDPHQLRLLTTYLLPVLSGALLVALWRFGRSVAGSVRTGAFVAGCLFHVFAAGLDLFVTTRADPYLTLEANPYIRVLLDRTEHSYAFIYGHTALTQILFVGVFVMSWWAFLRHQPRIRESVFGAEPKSWPAFVKAATGGGRLTYRQWLFPLRPREIPNPYHSVWPVALAVSFGTSLVRYWAVAEWLWLVPAGTLLRMGVLLVGVCGTLLMYYCWLALGWRRALVAA